jgi:hypothetical protein
LGISHKQYRQALSKGRKETKVFESKITREGFTDIPYQELPSRCMNKYRQAFYRHDTENFKKFIEEAQTGKNDKGEVVKMNSKDMMIYEIVNNILSRDRVTKETGVAQWNNLPNYLEGFENQNVIVCPDISGSMNGAPIECSTSLASYFAMKNTGVFKNKYISFSSAPILVDLSDVVIKDENDRLTSDSLKAIFNKVRTSYEGSMYCTNVDPVFELLYSSTEKQLEVENTTKETCQYH